MMYSLKRFAAGAALVLFATATPGMALAAGPLDGLTIPSVDPAIAFVAPTPDQPNYDARLQAFLSITVPDEWNGMPVQFLSTLNATGVDQIGLPVSAPKADPNNPQFIYQRFQNVVLFYNATDDTTQVLPLAE
jgi:hypothetical protein